MTPARTPPETLATPPASEPFRVGQNVIWERTFGFRRGEDVIDIQTGTVVRIGRKWGCLTRAGGHTEIRFSLADGEVDDNYASGTVYRDQADCDRARAKKRATAAWHESWDALSKAVKQLWTYPTPEQFAEIRAARDRAETALRELGEWNDV